MDWDANTEKSTVSCSAFRFANSPQAWMELKFGHPYEVTTGYVVYENKQSYDDGTVYNGFFGEGAPVTMTFEGAAVLAAGASLLAGLMF